MSKQITAWQHKYLEVKQLGSSLATPQSSRSPTTKKNQNKHGMIKQETNT